MATSRIIEGWVFDVQEEPLGIGIWIIDKDGKSRKLLHNFKPYFFITGNWASIKAALKSLERWHAPIYLQKAEKKEFYSDRPIPCLKVSIDSPFAYTKIVKALTTQKERRWDLYTCDIPVSQLFFIETGLFPTASISAEVEEPSNLVSQISINDSPWETDYSLPPLQIMEIEMEGGSGNPSHRPMGRLTVKIDQREIVIEEDPLTSLKQMISRYDPHVIVSRWGDSYLMPKLQRLAAQRGESLPFSREQAGNVPRKRGRSYFTYGKILFTASSYTFKGRWHLDLENSFTLRECGLEGLIELARLSKIPIQRMARTSTGTCISSMQVDRAIRDGYLIPWRKSQVEGFKTAEELLLIDKGGLTYRPVPGFYEEVAEFDFASMYPTLMAKFNLSPETVNCQCCPDAPTVPEAGFRVCSKREGLIPKTIRPLIEKRKRYKEKIKLSEDPILKEIYDRRQRAHKWCLVTCFAGDTVVLHQVDGRWKMASIREIVEAYLPGSQWGKKPVQGLTVSGIDRQLQSCTKPVRCVIKTPAPAKMVRARLQWGRELLMTPDHLCWILRDSRLELKRADQLAPGEWMPIAVSLEGLIQPDATEVDLVSALHQRLPPQEQRRWRVSGSPLKRVVRESYQTLAAQGRGNYSAKTIWNWREYGYLPLSYFHQDNLDSEERAELFLGRGRLAGGRIQWLPSQVKVDEDLGFLLGFFAGDGSATGHTLRFDVGADEREHLVRLRAILQKKFRIQARQYREFKARMYVLQANSAALAQVFKEAFGVKGSAERGKLHVPEIVLNGPPDAQRGFILGLIASDGSVSRSRSFFRIASASRRFISELGLLFSLLGVDHRFVRGNHLDEIQAKNLDEVGKILYRGAPASEKHLRALRYRRSLSPILRHPQVPVQASGLLELSRRARVARAPRVSGIGVISKAVAHTKLQQILQKGRLLNGGLLKNLSSFRRLVESPLIFARVISVEEVPYSERFVYCFELSDEPAAFFIEGGVLTHNCFGYLGYKNARFGKIEAHESTTAWGREMLLRAKEVAEQEGFKFLHGLTDSLWVKKDGAKKEDYLKLGKLMEEKTGIPIALEGIYYWISFLHSKQDPRVGVPSRFFGLFDTAKLKVRGLMVRKHDTPFFVKQAMGTMLDILSHAWDGNDYKELLKTVVLPIAESYMERLMGGRMKPEEVAILKRLSHDPLQYTHGTMTATVSQELLARGVKLMPGEAVQMVITDATAKDPSMRARALGFLDLPHTYDREKYREIFLDAIRELDLDGVLEDMVLKTSLGTPHEGKLTRGAKG